MLPAPHPCADEVLPVVLATKGTGGTIVQLEGSDLDSDQHHDLEGREVEVGHKDDGKAGNNHHDKDGGWIEWLCHIH